MRYKTDRIPDQPLDMMARAATRIVAPSGDPLADGVLSGYGWKGDSLTYAFPDSKRDYGYKGERDKGFASVNGKIEDAARWVLDKNFGNSANDGFSLEGLTDLHVSKGSDKKADIRYAESSSANPTAYAYYPTGGERAGDVWFGKDHIYDTPKAGNYAFATVLHETGHALGLKHGHDATSFDRIKTTLHGKYDSLEYSVMTYHSYPGQKGSGYTNEKFGFPQSFMMADIRALQHIYGADFDTNSGDTVYSWSPKNGKTMVDGGVGISPGANRIFATIWDGGGVDTYDLHAYKTDLVIDLRPGHYSVFSKRQLADLDQFRNGKDAHGNIYNALLFKGDQRSLIENAIGGSGDDKFRGNAADNTFTGKGGADIFFFRAGAGNDTITDFNTDFLADTINLKGMGLDFNDILAMSHEDGNDLVIDFSSFGNDDSLTLKNVGKDQIHDWNFDF